jgi:hypothetical protein
MIHWKFSGENKTYLRLAISIFLANWLVNEYYHEFQLIGWNYCCDNDVRILIVKVCLIYLIAWGESERKWMVCCFIVLIILNKDNSICSVCKKKKRRNSKGMSFYNLVESCYIIEVGKLFEFLELV